MNLCGKPNTWKRKSFHILQSVFIILGALGLPHPMLGEGADRKEILILEIIPPGGSDYIVSSETRHISIGAVLGLEKFKENYPHCSIELKESFKVGTEEDLAHELLGLRENANRVVVGLSRSNFARAAAKIAIGTDIRAISIGASTSKLAEINPNFISVASSWESQYEVIKEQLPKEQCEKANTLGIFDSSNYLSNHFYESFLKDLAGEIQIYTRELDINLEDKKCVFIGMNYSDSQNVLSVIKRKNWSGTLFGIGDWNIYSEELKKTLQDFPLSVVVYVPTGWDPAQSSASSVFSKNFKSKAGEEANPIAAYTYDATLLAANALCQREDPVKSIPDNIKILLLRTYDGKSSSGNYISKMHLLRFKGNHL